MSSASSSDTVTPTPDAVTIETVAVVGATGAIGKCVVDSCLNHPNIQSVVAVVRRAGCLPAHPKLTEKVVDFDNLPADAFGSAEVVYSCLGSTIKKAGSKESFLKQDHDVIVNVAKVNKQTNPHIKEFSLVSSVGADINTSNFYLRTKAQIEEQIKTYQFPTFSIYRPSILDSKRSESRPGEKVGLFFVKYLLAPVFCFLPKYAEIKVETVAQAMVTQSLLNKKERTKQAQSQQQQQQQQEPQVQLFDGSGAIKEILKKNTEEAVKAGAPSRK